MDDISTTIYAADVTKLKKEALYRAAYEKVTNERRKKTDGFRFQKDRQLSLGAELLLMHGLERRGMNLEEMSYHYGINGKPYLSGGKDLYFNLSHSEEMVICAISSQEIGCDIEKISDINLKIADRFFSVTECEMIASQKTERLKREMFFRLWTLKESFIKSTGMGMRLPMNAFCIHFDSDGISVKQELNNRTYYLQEWNLCRDYKCSVCGLDWKIAVQKGISLEILDFSHILTMKHNKLDL